MMKTVFANAVDAVVDKMVDDNGIVTLGEVQAVLQNVDNNLSVRFSDGTFPTQPHSYRGFYRFVAFERSLKPIHVAKFLTVVKQTIGATFIGWKGGEFTMTRRTPIWVSDQGQASHEAIIDIRVDESAVVLAVANIHVE